MIPTDTALRLTADRQRELEHRAARRRLVNHLQAASCRPRPFDTVVATLRHLGATLTPRHRPTGALQPVAATATCCCAA